MHLMKRTISKAEDSASIESNCFPHLDSEESPAISSELSVESCSTVSATSSEGGESQICPPLFPNEKTFHSGPGGHI